MPHVIFTKEDYDLDFKKLRFRKYQNIWDVRYKEESNSPSKTIYLKTPVMELSMMEEDADNYYLICQVNPDDDKFCSLIHSFDMATREEISEDCESWGFKPDTPISVIEQRFIPTMKVSSVNYEASIHLVIPKESRVDIYDKEKNTLKLSQLERGSRMAVFLQLDGVNFESQYFSLKFVVEQIMVKLPPKDEVAKKVKDETDREREVEEECLLEKSEDDDLKSYYNPRATKYSHNPVRPDIYENETDYQEDLEDD